ncbi:hypothetical protein TELCIR_00907 [Teladorsagia circumcincta]|uniref:Uncharacterized protein n=1 Tax=Teladorsagia circumcincta TaxID=45464 RepID=A0A2G9V3L6_TELCI|nr:hypothetical protein TELCIR_00907 [Teladorsagia circumcincta]
MRTQLQWKRNGVKVFYIVMRHYDELQLKTRKIIRKVAGDDDNIIESADEYSLGTKEYREVLKKFCVSIA